MVAVPTLHAEVYLFRGLDQREFPSTTGALREKFRD